MKVWTVAVWMIAGIETAAMAASQSAAAQNPAQSQIEEGRTAVTQVCVGCHGGGIMRMLEVREKSEQEWRETVYRMIGRGAQVFPDEIEPLTAYLVASTGRRRQQALSPPAGGQPAAANVILARRCQQCHDIAKATAKPASEDWRRIIDRMVTLGASVTPEEQQTLIQYLTALDK